MTKNDLMPLAKTYFDSNSQLLEIFGTEDKHFFYREIQAQKYCKGDKKYFHFLKNDFKDKEVVEDITEDKEVKLTAKQLLQKEATDLCIEFDEKTTSSDLRILIDLKNEEK